MLALLGLIPGFLNVILGWEKIKADTAVALYQARTGADRDVAAKVISEAGIEQTARVDALKAVASSRLLTWLVILFALPWLLYDFKVVAIDNLFDPWWYGDLGSTPAIKGQVGEWGGMIHSFIFGSSTALALGHMWFSRPQS